MKKLTVVTIGRQYGSGGREIGRGIAEHFGIPFYDKELIVASAKKSGLSETMFENVDEQAANSLLYSLVMGAYAPTAGITGMPPLSLNETLFQVQSDVIKELAQKESCVLVGRCADYILRGHPSCVNLFLHAPLEKRLERVIGKYGVDPAKAEDTVRKTDKKRANFYNYYSGQRWGEAKNYHISMDTSLLGTEGSVRALCAVLEHL